MKFRGYVKFDGNHYFANQVVKGSAVKIENNKLYLYDDEEQYEPGLGDFTRYDWVEVSPTGLMLEGENNESN